MFELYGLSNEQAQRIIEYAVQVRDGLITKYEMAEKIEEVIDVQFETTAGEL